MPVGKTRQFFLSNLFVSTKLTIALDSFEIRINYKDRITSKNIFQIV